MKAATIVALLAALTLAGCGSSTSAPTTVTVTTATPSAQRITADQLAQGFIDWDGVKTHTLKLTVDDGCDRLAVNDTGATYYQAVVVISPGEACDTTMSVEEGANSMHVDRNIWIEWPDGTDSTTRVMVQSSALAAYVTLTVPG